MQSFFHSPMSLILPGFVFIISWFFSSECRVINVYKNIGLWRAIFEVPGFNCGNDPRFGFLSVKLSSKWSEGAFRERKLGPTLTSSLDMLIPTFAVTFVTAPYGSLASSAGISKFLKFYGVRTAGDSLHLRNANNLWHNQLPTSDLQKLQPDRNHREVFGRDILRDFFKQPHRCPRNATVITQTCTSTFNFKQATII